MNWKRRRARPQPPARRWFQSEDGTFYRNCPLIAAERDEVMAWPALTPGKYRVLDALAADWSRTFREGAQRKPCLDPGDVVSESVSFREAYPCQPGLWVLDDL